jgi:hypothetical protein
MGPIVVKQMHRSSTLMDRQTLANAGLVIRPYGIAVFRYVDLIAASAPYGGSMNPLVLISVGVFVGGLELRSVGVHYPNEAGAPFGFGVVAVNAHAHRAQLNSPCGQLKFIRGDESSARLDLKMATLSTLEAPHQSLTPNVDEQTRGQPFPGVCDAQAKVGAHFEQRGGTVSYIHEGKRGRPFSRCGPALIFDKSHLYARPVRGDELAARQPKLVADHKPLKNADRGQNYGEPGDCLSRVCLAGCVRRTSFQGVLIGLACVLVMGAVAFRPVRG